MRTTEDAIREIFESVGIEATEDQTSSVAFDLIATMEEYEHGICCYSFQCPGACGRGSQELQALMEWLDFEDIEDILRCLECDGLE